MAKPKNPCEMLVRIGNELNLLWVLLDAYQELFLVEQDKRAKLLADTAPGFFMVVQVALIESILMRIFRLMDEAEVGGGTNCSFDALRKLLAKQPPAQRKDRRVFILRLRLRQLRKDWRLPGTLYARLKKIRNKELAHNDFTHHARREHGQLWMALSAQEFEVARSLGNRLWALYQQARLAGDVSNELEPMPKQINGWPSVVLSHLCSSLFLDQLMGDERHTYEDKYANRVFEFEHMGEDCVRRVFDEVRK